MIRELSLEGFRSFRDRQQISFAPLTFIYGPNSAGKSSIIKSLLLLQQSVQFSSTSFPVFGGPLVDLGSVWDTVHGHQANGMTRISLVLDADSSISRTATGESSLFTKARVEFGLSIDGHHDDLLEVELFNSEGRSLTLSFSRCGDDLSMWVLKPESLPSYLELGNLFGDFQPEELFPTTNTNLLPVFSNDSLLPGHVYGHLDGTIRPSYGSSISPTDLFWNRLATDLVRQFRTEMGKISYLGPLRKPWERTEKVSTGEHMQVVGSIGENSLSLLKSRPELLAQVNTSLSNTLECGYRLHLNSAQFTVDGPDRRQILAPTIMPTLEHLISGVHVSPVDAGFGLSQLLPIVVEMHLRERSTILIEQPELHLHPRLQARMGQLLRNAVSGRNQNRFIIETHSEHLILRIRRLIRQKLISPEMVQILYVNNQEVEDVPGENLTLTTTLHSHVLALRLDRHGDFIDPWPNGFFDERFEELDTWGEEVNESLDATGGFGTMEV